MMFFDHIENSYRSLRSNRARSILTTLGIAIGVGSVVTILALASGVTSVIDRQIEALDGNLAVVRPGLLAKDPNAITSPVAQNSFSTSSLTEEDVKAISELPTVASAAPIMTIDGRLTADNHVVTHNVVVATTPSFTTVSQLPVRDGQFIDDVTDKDTAVIGSQLAIDLFGTDRPIGRTFELRGQRLTVIGILKKMQDPINYNNVDFDHAAIVSLEAGKTFHQGRAQIQQINVRSKGTASITSVASSINDTLRKTHLGEDDYTVASGKDIARPTSKLFVSLAQVMVSIAAVSLFVGGIGIMNIMLVGVAERTREIGIRKAVGASNANIVSQFLMESLIISLLGGLLGYFLGYIAAFVISTFLYFAPSFTLYTVLAALAMSVGTGVVFGLYPAIRASRKDTIESLRQYH